MNICYNDKKVQLRSLFFFKEEWNVKKKGMNMEMSQGYHIKHYQTEDVFKEEPQASERFLWHKNPQEIK